MVQTPDGSVSRIRSFSTTSEGATGLQASTTTHWVHKGNLFVADLMTRSCLPSQNIMSYSLDSFQRVVYRGITGGLKEEV